MWQTSNPALTGQEGLEQFSRQTVARSENATLSGVVNKTGILVTLTVITGGIGYAIAPAVPWLPMAAAVSAFVFFLIVGFALRRNPALAPKIAWVYAVVEGLFLGSLTALLDKMLLNVQALQATTGEAVAEGTRIGLALPAFVITISVMLAMLGLYSTRIIRPTRTFVAIVSTATGAIMLTYLISFVMSFFGISMPFLGLGSAMQGGTPALIGIGLNVLILGVAAAWLIIDFKTIEDIVEAGSPKYMEWYGAFALLTTLAWIYYEAVKLVFRLMVLLGNRD